jgi:glycosyltransferase involved in cell wall biosynthesis
MENTISVIVPIFHYARFTKEALQSVVNQSVKPHEIILVNDGCIDNSMEVVNDFIKEHPEHNWKIINKENGGLASARNAGIKLATGKYVCSFDSDDIMRPDCLKEHLKLADENTVLTCGLMAFGNQNYTAVPQEATVEILLKTNVIYSNSLFPKQAWIDVGGYDECDLLKFGWEDREFFLRVIGAGYISKVSYKVCLLWRRHGNNMSETLANPRADKLQEYIYNKNKHLLKG